MDTTYLEEKNVIASSGTWIWLIEITLSGQTSTRRTNNNETVSWGGYEWHPAAFAIDDINESTSGEFPEYRVQIDDADLSGSLRTRIQNYDGLIGETIRFRIVHSAHLDLTTPAIDESVEVLSCEVTAQSVIFTVGLPNLLGYRFPRDRYVPGFCRHKFKGGLCKYVTNRPVYTSDGISFGLYATKFSLKDNNNGFVDFLKHFITPIQGTSAYMLTTDIHIIVSGSSLNNGTLLAISNPNLPVYQDRIYVEAFVETEAAGEPIQLSTVETFTFDTCDHTLEACTERNNSINYGGSPGIVGGVYG